MDAAKRIELIRELCAIEGRGPGTDAERRAAKMLAGRLERAGREVRIEPTHVHPQWALLHALHAVLAIAGSVLAAVLEPAAGFALVLACATSAYLDLNTRAYLLRRLFFRRASQNVVSPGGRPGAPLRLLLVARYDAPRSGWIFGERELWRRRRLGPRGRVLLAPWRIVFWGGIVALLPVIGAQMAGLEGGWLSALQLLPTIVLAVSAFLLLDIGLSGTTPGAYANASGVAAVLAAAERVEAEGLAPNLDLWVVLPGGGDALAEGMRAFVRADPSRLEPGRSAVVNVEGVCYGNVHHVTGEGAAISARMDPELISLCEALGGSAPVRSADVSDAQPVAIRRRRAITITGLADGLPPPWQRSHEDTPERVVESALTRATDLVVELTRRLDREAAAAAARSPAEDTARPAEDAAPGQRPPPQDAAAGPPVV